MRRMRLTVGINTKLNRGHLVHGERALILPCLARGDIDMQASGRQAITVEDSMSMVHASIGLVEPPSGQLRSEVAIVCGMASATLPGKGIDWDYFVHDYNRIREKIEACCRSFSQDSTCGFANPAASILPTRRATACGIPLRVAPISWSFRV
jgi:hypothetical protein